MEAKINQIKKEVNDEMAEVKKDMMLEMKDGFQFLQTAILEEMEDQDSERPEEEDKVSEDLQSDDGLG